MRTMLAMDPPARRRSSMLEIVHTRTLAFSFHEHIITLRRTLCYVLYAIQCLSLRCQKTRGVIGFMWETTRFDILWNYSQSEAYSAVVD